MMCTPAFRRVSTTHSLESPIVRNIQSTSPFGPPIKPSRETDIFNTSFLFVAVAVAIVSPDSCEFVVLGRLLPIWSLLERHYAGQLLRHQQSTRQPRSPHS